MINAVSDIGGLLLLLLIGMETDLALVKHVHRTAAITSAAGIVIPFGCGYVLREMLPDSVLRTPALAVATSPAVSSVWSTRRTNHCLAR
jgi:Kef-type K+ transport system membrane component KefB